MKKIAALIVIATVLAGTLSAYDVSWGGWVESKARMTTDGGGAKDELSSDDKKSVYKFGATEFTYTLNAVGEGFGFSGEISSWSDVAAGSFSAPVVQNSRIWSTFADMFTLSAGISMKHLNYAPSSIAAGGLFFDDQLGRGFGKYNYEGDEWTGWGFTAPVTGITGEVAFGDLSAAVVFRAPSSAGTAWIQHDHEIDGSDWIEVDQTVASGLQEDEVKKNLILQAKYNLGVATAYAGFALRTEKDDADKDVADHGLWIAASTALVDGLTADVKYETNLAKESENQAHMVALNLGYELAAAGIASDITLDFVDDGGNSDAKTMGWNVALRVSPYVVPVVDVSLDVALDGNNAKDAEVDYAIGLNVSKGVGNVGNTLRIGFDGNRDDSNAKDPINQFVVEYAINMWF